MAGLRAVDEAILQRDAKAAPQEALSFRPPDNSPFRRHFTRGFLLCLYAYSTRFAWECQCPFCTNSPGASLCRLRDARSGGGPVRRKTRAGRENGRGGRDFPPRRGRGNGKPVCAQTKGRANRISLVRRRFDRVFPRRRTARFFLVPARRNRVSSAYRRTDRAFPCAVEPTASCAGGRPYGKTPRGRTLLRRGAFFAGSDLLRLFAEQPSDQRAQQARRTEAVNFQKNQPLPFYVISKRA